MQCVQACGLAEDGLSRASVLLVEALLSALPSPGQPARWAQPTDGVRLTVTPGMSDPQEWGVTQGV